MTTFRRVPEDRIKTLAIEVMEPAGAPADLEFIKDHLARQLSVALVAALFEHKKIRVYEIGGQKVYMAALDIIVPEGRFLG